jgi:hypothetical protein
MEENFEGKRVRYYSKTTKSGKTYFYKQSYHVVKTWHKTKRVSVKKYKRGLGGIKATKTKERRLAIAEIERLQVKADAEAAERKEKEENKQFRTTYGRTWYCERQDTGRYAIFTCYVYVYHFEKDCSDFTYDRMAEYLEIYAAENGMLDKMSYSVNHNKNMIVEEETYEIGNRQYDGYEQTQIDADEWCTEGEEPNVIYGCLVFYDTSTGNVKPNGYWAKFSHGSFTRLERSSRRGLW